ncbi:putative immunoglobulin-blocking virulence protein [Mycoplasmopsis edwardii]|uniref:Immunoglobulin-blocking virulence protein n=1 Tax=Mycoplasmopsis edwardii TaxID=53558 RepID=A0ACD4PI82_9BACT|nr:putative immunoglobulin-blocking virulence protein [Mycoplasmopsis edwardii]WBP83845.1 putative immunoglobulin-blocking virulence protein [Mycoplasmopsis edwardii]
MLLNRKAKSAIIVLSGGIIVSAVASTLTYKLVNDKSQSQKFTIANLSKPNFISNDNLDLTDIQPTITDINLKVKEKPTPLPIPDPNTEPPKITIQPTPDPIVVQPEPIPEPQPQPEPDPIIVEPEPIPQPEPQPEPVPELEPEPQPSSPPSLPETDVAIIRFGDINVRVHVEPIPRREYNKNDINKGIANRKPYISEVSSDLKYVEVTEELRRENRKQAGKALRNSVWASAFEGFFKPPTHWEEDNFVRYYESSPSNLLYFNKIIDKFDRLLENGDAVYEYLTDEGKKLYPELKKIKHEKVRKLRIISYIDTSKFVLTSDRINKNLEKGYVLKEDNDNIYITADGKLDSYSESPLINVAADRLIKDNSSLRTFGYNSYYGRTGKSIEDGTYPGWTKTNVTNSEEYAKYNVGNSDGIKIEKITRDKREEGKRNEGTIITIDAANIKGYNKTINFLRALKEDNKEITSIRITNMGVHSATQEFGKIFKELPRKIPQLELFFETHNTESLLNLEDIEIDELSLFTSGNSNAAGWSINPWALKNVAWVNSIDYNVSFDYKPGLKVPTRLSFDDIAFDDTDFDGSDYSRINNGLRMVYWVRNNERVFQGGFGPGLKPDRNEGENSYPVGLDLSRVTKMKSLRNLQFHDIEKPSNKPRKLRRLVLHNNKSSFEIDTDELNNANFEVLDRNPMSIPKSYITFSNGSVTKYLKITSKNGVSKLNSSGLSNLSILINYSNGRFNSNTTFKVPYQDIELINQLRNLGYRVQEINPSQEDEDDIYIP